MSERYRVLGENLKCGEKPKVEQTQYSKLISDIPEPDIAISMGCNVGCPFIGRPFDDNWGLDDPTGQSDAVFEEMIRKIHAKILELIFRVHFS